VRFIALDFETSGLDAKVNAPVSLGVAVFDGGSVTASKEWTFAPPKRDGKVTRVYDVFALKVSGKTLKEIENGEPISVVMTELAQFVRDFACPGDTVVAFNAPFDLSFYSECLFLGGSWNQHARRFETFKPPLIGPWQCARMLCVEYLKLDQYNLDSCAAHFGLSRSTSAHGALEDAILAGQIYSAICDLQQGEKAA
jgi:DNA polymerase III epsilon subunit-like protein